MPAPTLDGFATGTRSGANQVSATLTTTQTNDIICAVVHFELNNTLLYGMGVSGAGLTWNLRSRAIGGGGSGSASSNPFRYALELWWAVAPSALAAQVLTITTNANFDDASMVVFGVHGCNTTNPWDANVSLPARSFNGGANAGGSNAPVFTGVSTTNANDFLVFSVGSTDANPGTTVPAGFTSIANAANSGGTNFSNCSVGYQGVTSPVASQTYTWGASAGVSGIALFEALTADTGGAAAITAIDLEGLVCTQATNAASVTTHVIAPAAGETLLVGTYADTTQVVSGVSGGALTWTRRIRSHGSPNGSLEIWSATSGGALASTTVTVTFGGAFANGAAVFAMLLRGAASQLFDANAALPATASNTTSAASWTPSATVATSQAHDIILAMAGVASGTSAASQASVPSGFRCAEVFRGGASGGFQYISFAYQPRSTTLSTTSVAWGAVLTEGTGAQYAGEMVVDAITADTAAAGGGATQARAMVLA